MNTNSIAIIGLITGGLSLLFSAFQFFRNRNQQVETNLISIMQDYIKSQDLPIEGDYDVRARKIWQWSARNLLVVQAFGRYWRLVPWWERHYDQKTKSFLKTFQQLLDEDREQIGRYYKKFDPMNREGAANAQS